MCTITVQQIQGGEVLNRPYDFLRDHINIHNLNRKKINIRHQGPRKKLQVPMNEIRPNKMARYPRETKRHGIHEKIE